MGDVAGPPDRADPAGRRVSRARIRLGRGLGVPAPVRREQAAKKDALYLGASAVHFLTKLVLAAPASFFSLACVSQAAAPGAAADRQVFMKALRSSPFLPSASLLQVAILLCCAVGALALVSAIG